MEKKLTILFTSLGTIFLIAAWLFNLGFLGSIPNSIVLLSVLNGLSILFFLTALLYCKKKEFRAAVLGVFYLLFILMPFLSLFYQLTESNLLNVISLLIIFITTAIIVERQKGIDRTDWYRGGYPRYVAVYVIAFIGSAFYRPLLSLALLIIILWMVTRYLKIDEDHIIYELELFNIVIYSRRYSLEDIKELKFMRAGWMDQGAILKLHKGMDIKLYYFKPENIYSHLYQFGLDNDVKINRTKDYEMLETRRKRKEKEIGLQ